MARSHLLLFLHGSPNIFPIILQKAWENGPLLGALSPKKAFLERKQEELDDDKGPLDP